MSLQKLAKHLETAGRNNDSMLVHMSPREVSGLQALARQHGGDLTINPHTGLVEAGFLESVLPTIAGLGLSLIPGVGPLAAAAMVGGGTTVATGSLEKGLMAGLGAYGGAGLGGSLANAGAAAAPQVATQAIPSAAADVTTSAVNQAAMPAGLQSAVTGSGQAAIPEALNVSTGASGFPTTFAENSLTGVPGQAQPAIGAYTPSSTAFSNMGQGFSDVTSSMDKFGDFASQNKGNLLASAAPIAYSMANPNSSLFGKDEPQGPKRQKSTQRPYSFSTEQNPEAYANTGTTAEQVYFDEPRFTALPTYQAKEGGLMGYAVGGPVEMMSAQNAVGANMMYPQSQYQTPMYSNPMAQRPMPTNVIQSGLDAPINPYSGEQRMAEGGIAHYAFGGATAVAAQKAPVSTTGYKFDPQTNQFTKSVTDYREVQQAPAKTKIRSFTMGSGYQDAPPAAKKYEPVVTETKLGGMAQPYQPRPFQSTYKDYRATAPKTAAPRMSDMSGFYSQMNQQLQPFSPRTGGLRAYAEGGVSHLGDYSDGGRLLKGPGDGVSDSIPASIGDRQPARLADGEFVVPARIVSELGNGSTDAGARKLYAMMDRVQKQRGKTTGKGKVAVNSKADKYMPA